MPIRENASTDGGSSWTSNDTEIKVAVLGSIPDENVLVSNLQQAQGNAPNVGGASRVRLAQPFTTGPGAASQMVAGVTISLLEWASGDVMEVGIYSNGSNNRPDMEIVSLTPPSTIQNGDLTLTAPGDTLLSPNTQYHLVFTASRTDTAIGYKVWATNNREEDPISQQGWSIGDSRYDQFNNGDWNPVVNPQPVRFKLNGPAIENDNTDATLARINMGNLGSPKLTGNRTEFIRWAGPDWPPPPIEAIPNSPAAVITYLDDADAVLTDADTNTDTLDVALDPGLNIVKIKVQSGDNSAETTYTLRLIRVQGVPEEIDSVPELHRNITVDVLPHARGFHNSRGTAGSTNLGNRRFRITPLTYQVRAILAVDDDFSDGTNRFQANKVAVCLAAHTPPQHSMRFEIAGEDFPLDHGSRTYGTHHCYQWPRPDGFDWSLGDIVPVKVFEDPTAPVPGNRTARGTPTLTVTPAAIVGASLAVNLGDIRDWNGLSRAQSGEEGYAYSFEWTRTDGADRETVTGTDAADGRSSSYELATAQDGGKTYRVTIRFRDDLGHYEKLTTNEVHIPAPSYGTQSTYQRETTPWTATLNPATTETGVLGCNNNSAEAGSMCSETAVLSEDEMTVDGTTATVSQISITSDRLTVHASGLNTSASDAFSLVVDGARLPFSQGIKTGADQIFWVGHGITPAVGTAVNLQLTRPSITATLTLLPGYEKPKGKPIYRLNLHLSQRVHIPNEEMKNHTFDVTNGAIIKTERINRVSWRWNGQRLVFSKRYRIHVRPTENTPTTMVSLPVRNCSAQGALCTRQGGYPEAAQSLELGLPALLTVSVADVTAAESTERMVFTVTSTRTSDSYIHVHYETTAGTATETEDYRPASGFTVIAPGKTTANIVVQLIDDDEEDSGETFTLTLTKAEAHDSTGNRIKPVTVGVVGDPATGTITNHEATGTIEDSDSRADTPAEDPTASFGGLPESHDGTEFTVRISFNEEFSISPAGLEQAITVTGGALTGAARTGEQSDRDWTLTVNPAGDDDVSIVLARNSDCSAAGALCTGDGRPIAQTISTTVEGPEDSQAPANQQDRPHGLQATAAQGAVTLTWQDPAAHPSYNLYQILRHRPELGETEPRVHVQYASTTDRTYTDRSVEPGVLYVYAVKAVTDPFGYLGPASDSVEVRMPQADSGGVAPVNSPASGAPSISGTAQVGEPLTADTSGISDSDGLDNASFTHQWLADDTDINEATASTYTPVSANRGETIKVRVSFTDDEGNDETLTSAATASVGPKPNSPATGAPTITGTPAVGSTLGVGITSVSDQNGLTGASYSYQWFRDSSAISGATDSTHTVVRADAGASIKVAVSFTDDDGYDETVTSEGVSVPLPPLTAELISTSSTPANHDGSSAFTIRLDFSENLSISYKTVRDHALEVTNARVTNAARVNRHGDERDRRWTMTIEPANTSDIEIWIRATTDCSANGAICTPDGKKLSGGLTMTIEGP